VTGSRRGGGREGLIDSLLTVSKKHLEVVVGSNLGGLDQAQLTCSTCSFSALCSALDYLHIVDYTGEELIALSNPEVDAVDAALLVYTVISESFRDRDLPALKLCTPDCINATHTLMVKLHHHLSERPRALPSPWVRARPAAPSRTQVVLKLHAFMTDLLLISPCFQDRISPASTPQRRRTGAPSRLRRKNPARPTLH
jgi:hypothetical protein